MVHDSRFLSDSELSGPVMLGEIEVRPGTNELCVRGEVLRLKPKVMLVLMQLIAGRGAVVTKSVLLDRVWPNMAVSESTLTEAIHEIRRALADSAKTPRYIQTISRRGYRIAAPVSRPATKASAAKETRPRIAVTNFTSLSDDPEDNYFCEGLCEELINSLGRNGYIDVLARTSTLEATGDGSVAADIAARLDATHLVSGSLRKGKERIRVIAHLIEVATGKEIWSEVYDRELKDFIVVQNDIAGAIGTAVTPHLIVDRTPAHSYVPDPEAFREFSKGRYFWKQDNANPAKAMPHYETAMRIDPGFAAPYAGMVECYNTLGIFHLMPQAAAREASTRYSEQAFFLDPNSPESLFAFGYTQFYMRWNWPVAEAAFHKCLIINPNHVLAHIFLALLYCPLGRSDDSRHHADLATRLDPFSPLIWWLRFLHYHYFRDFQGALVAAEHALEFHPDDVLIQWAMADSLVRLGRKPEARRSVAKLEAITAEFPLFRVCAGILYTMLDRLEEAMRIERELLLSENDNVQDPFLCGLLAIYLGRQDRALDMLERAEREHDAILWIIACEPYFDPLRDKSRFAGLLRRLHLSR